MTATTFALRAVWVVSPFEKIPYFERRFNSVECRAKKLSSYVPLPDSQFFVNALLVETGVKKSDLFVASRDGCDRACWAPAFELPTESGVLAPVVILQQRGLLLCGLPLSKWAPGNELDSYHDVAQTLDCLNMLAERLTGDVSQRSSVRSQLTQIVSEALPFGHPVCLSGSLSEQLASAAGRDAVLDKVKQPVWNPTTSKGKSQVAFLISEQVHCKMPLQGDGGRALVCGTLWASVGEVAGVTPEVSLTLTHPARLANLTLAPRVQASKQSDESTTLAFSPSPASRTALCHYSVASESPPLEARLCIQETGGQARLRLTLQPTRAALQRLEVTLSPSSGRAVVIKASVGAVVEEGAGLRWDVPPSKIKSRTAQLEASLVGVESSALECHAEISFKIADQTWTGCKIVPQSLSLVPVSKVKSSFSAETTSGHYRILSEPSST